MTSTRDRTRLRDPDLGYRWLAYATACVVGVVLLVWVSARVTGDPRIGNNPPGYVVGLLAGNYPWPVGATVVLLALVVGLVGIGVVAAVVHQRRTVGARPIDARGKRMGRPADLSPFLRRGLEKAGRELDTLGIGLGQPIGHLVHSFTWSGWLFGKERTRDLYSNYQLVAVWIMGPRSGKTTCVVIRQVMQHRGPAVVTSNKRDVVDLTRGPRSVWGEVWIYDVQGIIGEPATWWWNPLSYITAVPPAQQWGRAAELASVMIAAGRTNPTARTDAYFDTEASTLLATLFLAAAVADRPITDCYAWLANPNDRTAETLLVQHQAIDLGLAGQGIKDVMSLTPRQRDGVLGMCRSYLGWLRDPAVLPWITRTSSGDDRPHFDPEQMLTGQHTLYLISREGAGTARALTAALTVAVARTAEAAASRAGGRLPLPLALELDEAANVCRWPDLPDLYSHFGGRGILPSVFLQSWAQAVEAWGEQGAQKLWSAANVRVVGAGQADKAFLESVSTLIGDRDVLRRSTSHSKGTASISTSRQRERVLEVADLQSMPNDRAVFLPGGHRAALIKLVHYSAEPYAADIHDSEAVYAPKPPTSQPTPTVGAQP